MESIGNKRREKEFAQILDDYAQFLNIHVRKYDLQKYGLDPEDVLQDIRIKLWRLINDKKMIFSPGPYLKKVIASSVIDHLRKARREDILLRHEKQKHIAEIGHSYSKEAAHKKMFEETVGRAVSCLIQSRRQVVKLYLLNFSVQDISSYMNWSVDKTRNLLYRGLADLKKSLKDLEARNEVRK